jgi:hypothetical protein
MDNLKHTGYKIMPFEINMFKLPHFKMDITYRVLWIVLKLSEMSGDVTNSDNIIVGEIRD